MLKKISLLLIGALTVLSFSSCSEEAEDIDSINKQSILIYMPWTGTDNSTGLYNYFTKNIDSIETVITSNGGLSDSRLLVYLSESSSIAKLFEITYSKNTGCTKTVLKEYSDSENANPSERITELLNLVQTMAPALNYAMITGGHGTGWTKSDDWTNYPINAKELELLSDKENSLLYKTRFIGGISDKSTRIDIETLAEGINNSGIKLQYLLFDNCYMANIETAYELRNSTNFMIASTSELVYDGLPYKSLWKYLCSGTPTYSSIPSTFKSYYTSNSYYGSLAVIDCRELDDLAAIMKRINVNASLADSLRDSVQVLDGFSTPIFYDMTSYVTNLNIDRILLNEYTTQMSSVIRSAAHTDSLYTNLSSSSTGSYIKVKSCCGLTISDPSKNSVALKGMQNTEWYKATH